MNWVEYVIWTDTTAIPAQDTPDGLRAGLVEEIHEALSVWHEIEAKRHGAIKRQHRGDSTDWRKDELRATELERLRRKLISEVGDACWYAARICRVFDDPHRVPEMWGSSYGSVDALLSSFVHWTEYETRSNWASSMLSELLTITKHDISVAIADNISKLTARKAAGTIKGEGDR